MKLFLLTLLPSLYSGDDPQIIGIFNTQKKCKDELVKLQEQCDMGTLIEFDDYSINEMTLNQNLYLLKHEIEQKT